MNVFIQGEFEPEEENEEQEVHEEIVEQIAPCPSVASSVCSCAANECDVCGKSFDREIYWPPHDLLDRRNVPSIFDLKKYKKGLYCARTDLRSYMLPFWKRGLLAIGIVIKYSFQQINFLNFKRFCHHKLHIYSFFTNNSNKTRAKSNN